MLGDKQEQSVNSGSTAIQAGRDVYYGLSVTEVRDLCALFLRTNFPELREEARRTAEEYVKTFARILEQKLVTDAASIVLEKLREPDVQAAINDAVQASARKGAAANPIILSTLISERVAKNTNNYKDIVISEAVQVVPKLTSPQVALISFVHAVMSSTVNNISNVAALEDFGQRALLFSSQGFGLSESQKQHIQYTGAASINYILNVDIYDAYAKQVYPHLGFSDGVALKSALVTQAPSYAKLLDQFTADRLYGVQLTSVGQAIAIANISNFIGKLDYTIWLK
jgi:hypothetical protein